VARWVAKNNGHIACDRMIRCCIMVYLFNQISAPVQKQQVVATSAKRYLHRLQLLRTQHHFRRQRTQTHPRRLPLPPLLEERLSLEWQLLPHSVRITARVALVGLGPQVEGSGRQLPDGAFPGRLADFFGVRLLDESLPLHPEKFDDVGEFGGRPPGVFLGEPLVVVLVEQDVLVVLGQVRFFLSAG